LVYTKVRMFSKYCTNYGAEFPLYLGVPCTVVKRMSFQALSLHEMQMYVGIVTLMATRGVRDCTICRTEVVNNIKRNHISAERDMQYRSPKTTI